MGEGVGGEGSGETEKATDSDEGTGGAGPGGPAVALGCRGDRLAAAAGEERGV